ncbi:MAG: UbiX family flavin prenyltransferase [Deltaproteobacteria bacterium]|nr:UbiX family flavin prenyltransferase [Deltaproteobacteria bacterium]MCL5277545.1 UbiX family flavin prenyltransferase [Deltaproteobacteria bacterium]
MKKHVVVGITGASGSLYALTFLRWLVDNGYAVDAIASETGKQVFEYETGVNFSVRGITDKEGLLTIHDNNNLFSPLSSGSHTFDSAVLIPCSMGTMGRVASASGSKLIERIADVALKERRRLVIVPRETPLNKLHLQNMLALSSAGAVILPAMPGFYQRPGTIEDIVKSIVSKVLDAIHIPNDLSMRWGE